MVTVSAAKHERYLVSLRWDCSFLYPVGHLVQHLLLSSPQPSQLYLWSVPSSGISHHVPSGLTQCSPHTPSWLLCSWWSLALEVYWTGTAWVGLQGMGSSVFAWGITSHSAVKNFDLRALRPSCDFSWHPGSTEEGQPQQSTSPSRDMNKIAFNRIF